ncbi:hypothetical protein TrST_g725 [Triparma strigata]|uniref:Uncharacterized protein n=1 Tax=Triparma strigata TaxID=1606541 RepID=A0A9W7BCN8_9STRA|nr:hypothetical protein TrST_g725 [Triparma strigata]
MRWLDRKWHKVVEKKLTELEDEPFGEIIVHGGNDGSDEGWSIARRNWLTQVTKVVFLLNITKVGDCACFYAKLLVAVDIPEGITSIGRASFLGCDSLKYITFPKSLRLIGEACFCMCSSLERVDLLHTNAQELGLDAFYGCTSLREMKIPDSLQKFGEHVFRNCYELVPWLGDINLIDFDDGTPSEVTYEVVAHLRSIQ